MSLEELRSRLLERKDELSISYDKDPGYDYCKKYLEKNYLKNGISSFLDIDIWECAICLYYIKGRKEIKLDEIKEMINQIKKCCDGLDFRQLSMFFDTLFLTLDDSLEEDAYMNDYIYEKDDKKAEIKFIKVEEELRKSAKRSNAEDIVDFCLDSIKFFRNVNKIEDLRPIIDVIKRNTKLATNVFAYIRTYYEMSFVNDAIKKEALNCCIKNKEQSRTFSKFCKNQFSTGAITAEHNTISEFVRDEEKNEKNAKRNNQRLDFTFNEVLEKLEVGSTKQEITNIRGLIRDIKDPIAIKLILEYVNEHNKKYYDKLEEEHDNLSNNSVNKYQGVLSKYRINLHPSKIHDLYHLTIDELNHILKSLPRGVFDDIEYFFILKFTTIEIVDKIKKYLDMGFLDVDFLKEHIDFYSESSSLFHRYEDTLIFLNQHGINPMNFKSNPIILTMDSECFKNNIIGLEEYDYLRYLKTTDDYHFLLDEDLVNKIDLIIELGYEKYLVQDFSILNYDINRFKRLELLNMMNMPIMDIEGFMEILESSRFIVPDSELDSYLLNVTPYMDSTESTVSIDNLEGYRDKTTYSFNGIKISYPKVKRKLKEGYSLKEAICFNKNMSEEDYKILLSVIAPSDGKYIDYSI